MFLVLLSVNRAMKILIIGTKEEIQRASVAPLVGLLRLEVLNVPRVVRVRTVMAVEIVKKVNTVTAVTQLWIHAEIAQRVFTTTTLAKLHVCHAVPVNSIMFQVLILVNHVRKILTKKTKEEIRRALIVQPVGLLQLVVLNVWRVLREHTAMGVNLVQLVFTPRTPGKPSVWGAHQVITPRTTGNLFAWGAMPVGLLQQIERLNVPSANLDGMKMQNDLQARAKCVRTVINQTFNVLPALYHQLIKLYQQRS